MHLTNGGAQLSMIRARIAMHRRRSLAHRFDGARAGAERVLIRGELYRVAHPVHMGSPTLIKGDVHNSGLRCDLGHKRDSLVPPRSYPRTTQSKSRKMPSTDAVRFLRRLSSCGRRPWPDQAALGWNRAVPGSASYRAARSSARRARSLTLSMIYRAVSSRIR